MTDKHCYLMGSATAFLAFTGCLFAGNRWIYYYCNVGWAKNPARILLGIVCIGLLSLSIGLLSNLWRKGHDQSNG
jgi:hypothetical protein